MEANRLVPGRSQKELEGYVRKATRVALILGDLEEYKEAKKRF